MANNEDQFKKVVSHAKEYGYIFGSSEIYDGLSAVYDYGQQGVELKNNIREYWWRSMVYMHQNIVGIDAAILMHPTTWKASGHVDAFNDPLIDNKDSKKRYRADVLIEDHVAKIEAKTLVAHGHARTDDYYWLKDRDNPEVVKYLEAENAWTSRQMADTEALQDELFEEIKGRIKQDDSTVPYQPLSFDTLKADLRFLREESDPEMIRAAYRAEIEELDRDLGRLLGWLEQNDRSYRITQRDRLELRAR